MKIFSDHFYISAFCSSCGGVLTAVSLGGIALGRSISFYAVLTLFVFAVHMWLYQIIGSKNKTVG